ncbi:MAG TPA: hypothetical protein PKC28_10535 [Bdellovibrionales bacterium]|nr:hypothetical protein [Bdellovibrionales bacterium]
MKNQMSKIKVLAVIVSAQLLACQNAMASTHSKLTLNCHDGVKPMSIQWEQQPNGYQALKWEGFMPRYDWQLKGKLINVGNSVQIFGDNGPQLALHNEVRVQVDLRVGPLGTFAQGVYSMEKGGELIVNKAFIECQIIK